MFPSATHPARSPALHLLGGESVLHAQPREWLEWIPLLRQGLPTAAIEALLRQTGLSRGALAQALAIPERTLARRMREGVLSADESAKVLRFARVMERAQEVFICNDAALAWLQQDNAALGGVTPLSLLDTELGAEGVLDTLGRIEHGVFA